MALSPENVVTIALATVVLYNMLQTKGRLLYTNENALHRENEDGSMTKESWRIVGENILVKIPKNKNNHAQKSAEKVREAFADHLMDPGLFHGSGMYYCEQNRNDIGQTSKFNVICVFFNSYYCRKRLNTEIFWCTYHRRIRWYKGLKLRNFGRIRKFEKAVHSFQNAVLQIFFVLTIQPEKNFPFAKLDSRGIEKRQIRER